MAFILSSTREVRGEGSAKGQSGLRKDKAMATRQGIGSVLIVVVLWGLCVLAIPVDAAAQVRTLTVQDDDHKAIAGIIQGIVGAYNKRDSSVLGQFYRRDQNAMFFGLPTAPISKGTDNYLKAQGA